MLKQENGMEEIYLAPETNPLDDVKLVEEVSIDKKTNKDVPVMVEAEPKKNVRVGEIFDLRENNRKVFRMSDGTEQAVFYPQNIHIKNDDTKIFDDVDFAIIQDADGKHFRSGKNHFIAKFSREEENDELFSIESGIHRVTVSAKKHKKHNNKGVIPKVRKNEMGNYDKTDFLVFEGIQEGSDYEYSVTGNGVKENIVIKEKSDIYCYHFIIQQEKVFAQFDEQSKRIAFISTETGEEVFFIPTPFMTDANGDVSTGVSYDIKPISNSEMNLSVTADSDWINSESRVFPIFIDPQINISNSGYISTYSWNEGSLYTPALHKIGTVANFASNVTNSNCDVEGGCEIENPNNPYANQMANAISLRFNEWKNGSIACPCDEVWYKFVANASAAHLNGAKGQYTIYTKSSMDTWGELYDSNGVLLNNARNDDDAGDYYNFSITEYLEYGTTYYVRVKGYSSKTGNYSIGIEYENCANGEMNETCYSTNRMYMSFAMPSLPRNPRIKKAELTFYQHSGVCESGSYPKIGLYQVNDDICTGNCTPYNDSNLIDFQRIKTGGYNNGENVSYTFDITQLLDKINKNESYSPNLVLKMLDETVNANDNITIYGSSNSSYSPKIVVTYESSYGVNTSYRTHTHELGRFGQGSVDLQCGNLMFESEDFVWSGNRMPVTIKHLYNSALYNYQYTYNSSIKLLTAGFSAMKLGYGFKLNIMQSMRYTSFYHDGKLIYGYVYIGENGEETYFKQSDEQVCCDSNSQCYYLYKDVNDEGAVYDPEKRTLMQGEQVYTFDYSGRLVQIMDEHKNHMDIIYTSNRITTVTDGAGRDFHFAYNSSGFLTSITAPDDTRISYTYSGNLLSTITYQDGKKATFTYSYNRPTAITLCDSSGNNVYKVAYSYSGNRLYSVTEYGVQNGNFVQGAKSTYSYSVASSRTIVETTELMDEEEGECYNNIIKTVYTFDDDGNVLSEYVYSQDRGNAGAAGEESGINPHSGDNGAGVVSNINNLLKNHNFDGLNYWTSMPNNCGELYISNYANESYAKFGKKILRMQAYCNDCAENGVYQVTNILPIGQYAFSAYLRVLSAFSGTSTPGAYIRVTTTDGTVLAESEHITKYDTEYIRLVAPFELKMPQSVQVQILLDGRGTIHADAVQLENNPFANAYNMLENGNFEHNSGWCASSGVSYTSGTCFNMSHSLMMVGNLDFDRYATQIIKVKSKRSVRETFTLSGWAKGYGIPNHERDDVNTPQFRLRAVVKYSDGNASEEYIAEFSPCTEEWQFTSVEFAKSKYGAVDCIEVYCDYGYNIGTVYFDDIQLVRTGYEEDLTAEDFVEEPDEETTDTSETTATEEENAANDDVNEFKELLDKFGNTLTETTFTDGEFGAIYRSFDFNTNSDGLRNAGNDLIRETDSRGNVTEYVVDEETSHNEEVIDRMGNKTVYEYDKTGKTTKVTNFAEVKDEEGNTAKDTKGNIKYDELANVSYAYDAFDNMTKIVRGDGMEYVLKYNAFHNLESIGVDGKTDGDLIKYTYKNGNGRLKEITYANGDTMKATYNSLGQMVAEKWYNSLDELTAHYKYVYDGQGNIVRSLDFLSKKEYNYLYEDGKIMQSTESDIVLDSNNFVTSKAFVNTIRYYYNSEDTLTKKCIKFADNTEHTVNFEKAENDSQIVKFVAGGKTITSHSKTDNLGRKVFDELQLSTGFVSRQFSYHVGEATDNHIENNMLKSSPTTQLVSQIVLSNGRTLSYEYDAEERITKITDSVDGITEYTYDALGQLLTEVHKDINGQNAEVVNEMVYDAYGNILQKNGIQYVYDEVWKDKFTRYNGQEIIYDEQGNPTKYLGHNLTWEKGRQLKSFDNISYTYNANGIRTSKTIDGIRHDFVLDGDKILRETWDDDILETLYDNEDSVCGIIYNGEPYYFHKNLQGDIIAIADDTGRVVARYTYDAWGKCEILATSTNATIANINPYRYRGYYYDKETGLYYVSSRYYDPEIGRFVNGDEVENTLYTNIVLDYNIFTYVQNNPVVLSDSTGESWITDLWKKAKKGVSSAWNWLKKACSNVGNYFKNTVWKKWIVTGVWNTFCKKWVWEKFCKEMVYNTFIKKWVWQTFCKKWTWQTFCKKWVWQTFCKKWVWETFCKDWIANKAWNWVKSAWNSAKSFVNSNPIIGTIVAILGVIIGGIGLFVSATWVAIVGFVIAIIGMLLDIVSKY